MNRSKVPSSTPMWSLMTLYLFETFLLIEMMNKVYIFISNFDSLCQGSATLGTCATTGTTIAVLAIGPIGPTGQI